MINPHLVQPKYAKVIEPTRARKYYVSKIGQSRIARKTFRTATEAMNYSERVIVRWRRLFDAISPQSFDFAQDEIVDVESEK
jgi:hypothetical protein